MTTLAGTFQIKPEMKGGVFQSPRRSLVPFLLFSLVFGGASAPGTEIHSAIPRTERAKNTTFKQKSFTFVRVHYSMGNNPFGSGRNGSWATDWPESDFNFSATFQEETGLQSHPEGKVLQLTDPSLKEYPFIYMVEPGGLGLIEAEVKALRTYLLGGGFLMTDDSWGGKEWTNILTQMRRVFPDREPKDIPIEHPLFHCWFEINEKPQVPNVQLGIESQQTGITYERYDAKEAQYMGLFDDKGRLMVLFCHNTDLGDGWERESAHPYYFKEFSQKKAYPMGINAVVYALTH